MRTTLTLEDDVAARLNQVQKRSHASLKSIINESLRAGLCVMEKESVATDGAYSIKPAQLGNKLPELDNIAEILALDDE